VFGNVVVRGDGAVTGVELFDDTPKYLGSVLDLIGICRGGNSQLTLRSELRCAEGGLEVVRVPLVGLVVVDCRREERSSFLAGGEASDSALAASASYAESLFCFLSLLDRLELLSLSDFFLVLAVPLVPRPRIRRSFSSTSSKYAARGFEEEDLSEEGIWNACGDVGSPARTHVYLLTGLLLSE
jgi:hypothetical protein